MTSEGFSVDTHLFRELGELLVGRDSTALVELIKNSYDADATEVGVHAENLGDPALGKIVIQDNGLGMTATEFRQGFLKIASRLKEQGDRRSLRFNRRFTGAKGIGRLAAHKLASRLTVDSVANDPKTRAPISRIEASIDWTVVESALTLDAIAADAITLVEHPLGENATSGTTITLHPIRRRWTSKDLVRFVSEAQETRPPPVLIDPLPESVLAEPLLFARPIYESERGGSVEDPSWQLELTGDFDIGQHYWRALAAQAAWVLEIDATRTTVRYGVAPTAKKLKGSPQLERFEAELRLTEDDLAPLFQARILIREGPVSGGQPSAVRTWIKQTHGIRVFMEGFRVLPYGEPGDDWQQLDRDYGERSRGLDPLSQALFDRSGAAGDDEATDQDFGLVLVPNRAHLGAIFLTAEGARDLQMLVNREGFVPNATFTRLHELVHGGLGLATRVRAAANAAERAARRERRQKGGADSSAPAKTSTQALLETIGEVTKVVGKARQALAAGDMTAARTALSSVESFLSETPALGKEMVDEQAMIRVLASLGAQTAGFVHEINGLLGLANAIAKAVGGIRDDLERSDSPRHVQKLTRVSAQIAEMTLMLERQASYLVEIATPDKRRRRSRQEIRNRFESARRLLTPHAEKNNIDIKNQIPDDLRSPPMFPAELVAVFTNLLSNALKAAGRGGTIVATGRELAGGIVRVRLENTGKRVAVGTSEKWFLPFASTTGESDPILGIGMGLGLPITRRILDEYGATIHFIDPSHDFATAIEIRFEGDR